MSNIDTALKLAKYHKAYADVIETSVELLKEIYKMFPLIPSEDNDNILYDINKIVNVVNVQFQGAVIHIILNGRFVGSNSEQYRSELYTPFAKFDEAVCKYLKIGNTYDPLILIQNEVNAVSDVHKSIRLVAKKIYDL